jgi:hypothetical protein
VSVNITRNGNGIFITGEWTLPVKLDKLREIFEKNYQHEPNDGLFLIPNGNKTCLALSPDDVAKIALTPSDMEQVKKLLNNS